MDVRRRDLLGAGIGVGAGAIIASSPANAGTTASPWADLVGDYQADNTGITDISTAVDAALTSGDSRIYVPAGDYLWNTTVNLNANDINGGVTLGIHVECDPDARFRFDDLVGSALIISAGAASGRPTFRWSGGSYDLSGQYNSGVGGGYAWWPPQNPHGSNPSTANLFRIMGDFSRVELDRLDVRCSTTGHWFDAGGDTPIHVQGADELLSIHDCIFVGARDSALYLTGTPGTGDGARYSVTNNTFLNCYSAARFKNFGRDATFSSNHVDNCVFGLGGTNGNGDGPNGLVISHNTFRRCGVCAEGRFSTNLVVANNIAEDMGWVMGDGVRYDVNDPEWAPGPEDPPLSADFPAKNAFFLRLQGARNTLCVENVIDGVNIAQGWSKFHAQGVWIGNHTHDIDNDGPMPPENRPSSQTWVHGNLMKDIHRPVTEFSSDFSICGPNMLANVTNTSTMVGANSIDLGAPATPPQSAILDTDFTTTSTTLADIPSLAGAVVAGSRYAIDATLYISGPEAGDIEFGWGEPGSAGGAWTGRGLSNTANGNAGSMKTQSRLGWGTGANKLTFGTAGTGANDVTSVQIEGTLIADADGTLTLRARQGVSQANPAVVHSGSRFELRRLD